MTIDLANRRKTLARWHRRFAMLVSLWLVLLAVSGLMINHAHDWGLDHKPLSAFLQRYIYGFESSKLDICNSTTASEVDCNAVFARLSLPDGALMLAVDNLQLLDNDGQLVEKLAISHLGLSGLQAGFYEGSRIYLRDAQHTVYTDPELLEIKVIDAQAAIALDGREWQVRNEVSESISWERFLLDLHAARFLGPLAKIFNDLMAGLILILAVSGIWLYRIKSKTNGNGQTG